MRKEYNKDIGKLRKERLECRNRFKVITEDVENVLDRFALDEGAVLIKWKELWKLEMGELFYVNEKVSFIKTYQDDEKIVFTTYMEAGGEFGLQEHDIRELVDIKKGHLIEQERGDKVYEKGQKVIYAPYENHKPKSFVKSVYSVTFEKSKDVQD